MDSLDTFYGTFSLFLLFFLLFIDVPVYRLSVQCVSVTNDVIINTPYFAVITTDGVVFTPNVRAVAYHGVKITNNLGLFS